VYLGEFKAAGAKGKDAKFEAAFVKAVAAGLEAGGARKPQPMVICEMSNPLSNSIADVKKMWVEDEGACGFAWVNVAPGNSPFANWLKKAGLARKSWAKGVDIWISDFGQSVDRKEACANAMAKVLQIELGLSGIYAASRLD
jgi:hypothetical protein